MKLMTGLIAALILAAAPGDYYAQVEAAKQDYIAQVAQGYHGARYLYCGAPAPEDRPQLVTALKFYIPHISLAKPLEHQLPVRVGNTDMYRIDIDSLLWGRDAWLKLAKQYPYSDFVDPLIIRGDWLLRITADTKESTALYDLLYAQVGTPKNKAEFLKVFDIVVNDDERTATIIDEGKSGVAKRTRVVVEGPSSAGNWWESYDSRDGFGGGDLLEVLDLNKLKSDAQEFIVPIRKYSLATGERGIALVYFLTDGKGVRQEAAATDIVKDDTQFLGQPEIRTGGHCVACHAAFNGASENTFRKWVELGIERREKDKQTQEFREQFLLSKQQKIIARGNEDFETFSQLACGVPAKEAQSAYVAATEAYESPVSLEQAAREVYAADAEELQDAIAYYSQVSGPLEKHGRFASLTEDQKVSRKQFEGNVVKGEPGVYHQCVAAIALWRKGNK